MRSLPAETGQGASRLASRTRHDSGFRRALDADRLALLTLGSVIGSGLFLASAQAVRQAGPSALLAFALGIAVMAFESGALAEMSAAHPVPGSFLTYALRVFGPRVTFIGGWIYWFSSVLGLAAEAVAAGTFARLWFPGLSLWGLSFVFALLMVAINFAPVARFGRIEALMAGVKVVAAAVFVLFGVGAALLLVLRRGTLMLSGLHAALASGPLPHGLRGVGGSMLVVMFTLAGTGAIGLGAAESTRPERTVPAAIKRLVTAIAFLYLGSLAVIMLWIPWQHVSANVASPFVAVLALLGLPWGAAIFNFVLVTAVVSALGASLFSTNRVLYALARDGNAPAGLARLTRWGIPGRANVVSALGLAGAVLLARFLPQRAYLLLVSATGFQAMFIWLLVVATHIAYRRVLEREHAATFKFRLPGHPWLDYVAIALLIGILATAPLGPGQVPALLVGVGVAVLLVVVYQVVVLVRRTSAR